MKIGFSFGRCVADLVAGVVKPDDVVVIVSRTKFETREQVEIGIQQYEDQGQFKCAGPRVYEPLEVGLGLYDRGRLHQPRLYRVDPFIPGNEFVWMDLFPTNVQSVAEAEQVQKAWNAYRMALKLSIPGTLPSDEMAKEVRAHY